jgi:SAM-dependent methyltransferase
VSGDDRDRCDCCFDEWARANRGRAGTRGVAAPVTAAMLANLEAAGLRGRTVLDVGCGTGDLALGALERGATTAVGVDLGRGAIADARSLAEERGLTDRATFDVADGSRAPLPPADVVVLHRVLCCYPDAEALLGNTLPSAGSVFAFTAPTDRGAAGAFNRVFAWFANGWYRLRDAKFRGFRVAIHDLGIVEDRIGAAGFRRIARERRRLIWDLRVYERPAPLASS